MGKSTYYRWRALAGAPVAAPAGPSAEIVAVMRDEVRDLRQAKRRTWGTATIYRKYQGIIPRALITDVIREQLMESNRELRAKTRRYEFAAPDVAWSIDFIAISPVGRVLRVQDDRARCVLGYHVRENWPANEVVTFVLESFGRFGKPLFFKHDLGPEFSGTDFQTMLHEGQVIPLPNPPYYPRANGKMERNNGLARMWMGDDEYPTKEEVLHELREAFIDHNEVRPREILGGRTPQEVYRFETRVLVDRPALWKEWEALRADLARERLASCGKMAGAGELEVLRLTALALLRRHQWVTYSTGKEGPGLSH